MLSKQEVFEHYGNLLLKHALDQDCAHRVVFNGVASDGTEIQVIHSPTISIWEEYVKTDHPVCLSAEPDYRLLQVKKEGQLEFEEMQSYIF